jgi:acetoin utilization deacetylase AcuC-like enzyme
VDPGEVPGPTEENEVTLSLARRPRQYASSRRSTPASKGTERTMETRRLQENSPAAWLLDDAVFDAHRLGGGLPHHDRADSYHPERPERLAAARAAVTKAAVAWKPLEAREASFGELALVHHEAYLESLEELRGRSGFLDADTYYAPRSVEAARRAAGGLVSMVDRLIDSEVQKGVALVRPPGHHARPGQAMGFCLLNSIAVAAAHARARGLSRVLVVDWDVHHGNGTQEMFWRRPDVLYMSTHQFPFYPGTGDLDEVGEGEGHGFTVNVPLAAGGDDGVYRSAFEQVLLPVAEAYAPELVLVSAGFDAATRDPLANMRLGAEAFGWMAKALAQVADRSANGKGRIALVLEGGYDLVALESCLGSAIEGLLGQGSFDPARAPDHPDVARAREAAKGSWTEVE